MAKIHELSETLTNQIAAGEVIERPASVVKELVENAIDAQSKNIRVDFVDSGLKQITVQDDGIGIDKDQIDLAFMRHATSKIATQRDLFNISTLGFRGEALASIAAVAHVKLVTKTKTGTGIEAEFAGGKKISQKPSASRQGTKIVVKDLFYNTPARLKYLRSARTEMIKIIEVIDKIALGYPDIAFVLTNNGKKLLQTSGNDNLKQVAAAIYGRKLAENMLAIKGSNVDFKISGYISKPEDTRANRNYITLLLNGRYIRNYQLTAAIMAGYGSQIKKGRYPVAIIDIQLDPILVDVNVHPTKREVRLSKENELTKLLTSIIQDALIMKEPTSAIKTLHDKKQTAFDELQFNLNQKVIDSSRTQLADQYVEQKNTNPVVEETKTKYVDLNTPRQDDRYIITDTWENNIKVQMTLTPFGVTNHDLLGQNDLLIANKLPQLTYLGHNDEYIFAGYQTDIYLIDAKAAKKRISYERFLKQMRQTKNSQQGLLEPIILDFGIENSAVVKDNLDTLKNLGLYLEEFGDNTFAMHTYPVWLKGDIEKLARRLVDLFLDNYKKDFAYIQRVFANDLLKIEKLSKLTKLQAQNILEKLSQTSDPYHDSNGNLIMVKLSASDLAKMFKK